MATEKKNPVKALVEDIHTTKDFLEKSLNHTDPRTMHGMQSRQNEMMNKLAEQLAAYKKALRERGFAIFLMGELTDQIRFAEMADAYECFALDANVLYNTLATKMLPTINKNEYFSAFHVQILSEHLVEIGAKLNVASMPFPSMSAELVRPVNSIPELAMIIRSSIEKTLDTELSTLYIEDIVTDLATKQEYTGSVLATILLGADIPQIKDFSRRIFKGAGLGQVFVVSIGNDVTGMAEHTVTELTEKSVFEALRAGAKKFGFKFSKKVEKPTEVTTAVDDPTVTENPTVDPVTETKTN